MGGLTRTQFYYMTKKFKQNDKFQFKMLNQKLINFMVQEVTVIRGVPHYCVTYEYVCSAGLGPNSSFRRKAFMPTDFIDLNADLG